MVPSLFLDVCIHIFFIDLINVFFDNQYNGAVLSFSSAFSAGAGGIMQILQCDRFCERAEFSDLVRTRYEHACKLWTNTCGYFFYFLSQFIFYTLSLSVHHKCVLLETDDSYHRESKFSYLDELENYNNKENIGALKGEQNLHGSTDNKVKNSNTHMMCNFRIHLVTND